MLTFVSCNEQPEMIVAGDSQKNKGDQTAEQSPDLALGQERSRALVYAPLTKEQQAVADCETEFSFNFFKAVAGCDVNNIAVSPFSMYATLSMLSQGAVGGTYSEIISALGLKDITKEQALAYCKKITEDLSSLDNNVLFESASSFWYDPESSHPVGDYVTMLDKEYGAKTYAIDNKSLDRNNPVNAWARQKSHGMVQKVVDDNQVIRWLLANVTFFEGAWTSDGYIKEKQQFTDIAGSKSEKDFFGPKTPQKLKGFNIDASNTTLPSAIWIPYGNGGFSMAVLLPPADQKVDEFIASLTAEKFAGYSTGANAAEKVLFRVPCFENTFKIEKQNAQKVIKSLGVERAFKACGELTAMLEDNDACVDFVSQSAKIKVNENGTVAAAASVIGQGYAADLPVVREFNADRPFVYAIVDVHNTILFLGTVTEF